jgi:hypothetical protein
MTLEEFIGPSQISEKFSIRGDDVDYEPLWAIAEDKAAWRPAVWSDGAYTIHELDGFEPEGTFILVHDYDEVVGFYMDARAGSMKASIVVTACPST